MRIVDAVEDPSAKLDLLTTWVQTVNPELARQIEIRTAKPQPEQPAAPKPIERLARQLPGADLEALEVIAEFALREPAASDALRAMGAALRGQELPPSQHSLGPHPMSKPLGPISLAGPQLAEQPADQSKVAEAKPDYPAGKLTPEEVRERSIPEKMEPEELHAERIRAGELGDFHGMEEPRAAGARFSPDIAPPEKKSTPDGEGEEGGE